MRLLCDKIEVATHRVTEYTNNIYARREAIGLGIVPQCMATAFLIMIEKIF
jgi:hypothetical protein